MTRSRVCSSVSSANVLPLRSSGSGDMPAAPTMPVAVQVVDMQVAADADRVLAVEDELGRHRADGVDQLAEHPALEGAEALLLLERLVVAEALAAHLDREAARLDLGHVDVRSGRVTGLVDRDRARVGLGVLDVDRRCPTRSRSSRRRGASR